VLADAERCLALVVNMDRMCLVFDTTRVSGSGGGFAFAGMRDRLDDAKDLAERSLRRERVRISDGWQRGGGLRTGAKTGPSNQPMTPRETIGVRFDRAAREIEWAVALKDWADAMRCMRTLMTEMEHTEVLPEPEAGRTHPINEAAREIGKALIARNRADLHAALTHLRRAVAHTGEGPH
jgi:hypothetical protein